MDRTSTGKRALLLPLALIIAAMLVTSLGLIGMTPDTAYAASKTKVWVVSKVKVSVPKSMQSDSNWSSTYKYSYNKSGLITSFKDNAKSYYAGTNKYTYDKKNRITGSSFKNSSGDQSWSTKYVLDKKGRVQKAKGSKIAYKYNSKNQLVKYTNKYDASTIKYLYDKKNRLSHVKEPQGWVTDTYFIYDENNQIQEIQSVADGETESIKLTNTYKNGRLVKQVIRDNNGTKIKTLSFTYKKISVPKSLVKRVRSQQNWVFLSHANGFASVDLINVNTNFGVTKTVKATKPTEETVSTASATKRNLRTASI